MPRGGFVFKDATGANVPVLSIQFGAVVFADSRGYVWLWGGPSSNFDMVTRTVSSIYFASTNCSGTPYVDAWPARVTFPVSGESTIHALADNAAVTSLAFGSFASSVAGAGCTAQASTHLVAPYASTLPNPPLSIPTALPGVQPIRAEFIP